MRNNIFFCFGKALCQYASFRGRASRREFWSFVLVNYLIWNILLYVFVDLEGVRETSWGDLFVFVFYPLAMLLPLISVWCRRIHDVGHPAYYFIIPLYNIFLLFVAGERGYNRFGMDPLQEVDSTHKSKSRIRRVSSSPFPSRKVFSFSLLSRVATILFTIACTLHEAMLMKWLPEEFEGITRYLWLIGGATLLLSRLFLRVSKALQGE